MRKLLKLKITSCLCDGSVPQGTKCCVYLGKVQGGMMWFDTCPRWEDCLQMVFEIIMQWREEKERIPNGSAGHSPTQKILRMLHVSCKLSKC